MTGLLAIPGCWLVKGWVRHEHFYEGMPTSYWAGAVREWIEEGDRRQ